MKKKKLYFHSDDYCKIQILFTRSLITDFLVALEAFRIQTTQTRSSQTNGRWESRLEAGRVNGKQDRQPIENAIRPIQTNTAHWFESCCVQVQRFVIDADKDYVIEDILRRFRPTNNNRDIQFTEPVHNKWSFGFYWRYVWRSLTKNLWSCECVHRFDLQMTLMIVIYETHFDFDDSSNFVETNLQKLVPERWIVHCRCARNVQVIHLCILVTLRSWNKIALAIASSRITENFWVAEQKYHHWNRRWFWKPLKR